MLCFKDAAERTLMYLVSPMYLVSYSAIHV